MDHFSVFFVGVLSFEDFPTIEARHIVGHIQMLVFHMAPYVGLFCTGIFTHWALVDKAGAIEHLFKHALHCG